MLEKVKGYKEENKTLKTIEIVTMCLLLVVSIATCVIGLNKINSDDYKNASYVGTVTLTRDEDSECDEDATVCTITYSDGEDSLVKEYSDESEVVDTVEAYKYVLDNGTSLCFEQENPSLDELAFGYKEEMANRCAQLFNASIACVILALSVWIVYYFSKSFTTYEKSWFVSIMLLATIVAVLFPEEGANGVNGIIIMLLYLLDTFLNILCELLISKQSRYNFLVSVVVEITEILTCVVLMYRFATIATTLFFWLPIDILSYINWSKHKDDEDDELTAVRRLKGYQEVLIILGIIIWTFGVGYFLSGLDIKTDFLNGDQKLMTIITYIDACASAVGVCNGLFIFFRLREQWIAWYICAFLEAVINILAGQYVLLVLKLGYFTNTTYGYIKWTRYIKEHNEQKTLF